MNSLVALTPAGMLAAQEGCLQWADTKLADARNDLILAEQNFNALIGAKLRTNVASSMIRKARVRIAFYEKVKLALDAGYYIIPPFDVQVFAIRADKPPPTETGSRAWISEQEMRALPAGVGQYVDPRPEREHVRTNEVGSGDKLKEVAIYENMAWSQMELPARAIKPQVIEATGKALALKIFDALGIAPAFRSADPIIVGHIKRPQKGAPLTFFVAWWLDYSDL